MKNFLFLSLALIISGISCMEKGTPSLVSLGIAESFIPENQINEFRQELRERKNEFNFDMAELKKKIEGYNQAYGDIPKAEFDQKRLNLAALLFSGSALFSLGINRILPLVSPFVKRFWDLHPKSSVAIYCFGLGCTGFGLLSLLARYGHSQRLNEYKKANEDLIALNNLEKHYKAIDEGSSDNEEEKED
jgi:hypothetical protein